MLNCRFFEAIAVLIGTIIGAGIFGLPYAFAKIGFVGGLFYLVILAIVLLITYLCYSELILRTKDSLEMAGYAERYLGRWGRIIVSVSLIIGIYSALIAYTIGVGQFLWAILSPYFGGTPLIYSLIFWALASLIVLKGVGIVAKIELAMASLLIFVVLYIFCLSLSHINLANLQTFHPENLFFPYGVVLFALGGASAIPTMRRILFNQEVLLKRAVVIGLLIPAIIYFIFTFTVVGVTGEATSEEAIIGLSQFTNGKILMVGGIFGILAMTTSFLALGYVLRELLRRDYKIPLLSSWGLVIFIPLILFLAGLRSFVGVIGFAGGVLSGLQGIVLIAAYYQAKKKGDRQPEYNFNLAKPIAYFIYLIFILGIIYQFIY